MRAKSFIGKAGILATAVVLSAMVVGSALACTSMMAGKKATVDGSTIVSHTVDGWYDHRMQIVPGQKWEEGAMAPVYKNLCYQTMPTKPLNKVGEIPQVSETYTYFKTGYPSMNEHKLMMAEATWGGREESYCDGGWMTIEMLQVFALQRTKTARDAIAVMGALAEKYGYGDVG
ncbi:MAG: C69 family dipeptidase, partial [Dethiosulfovibrio sp.]|nr:C69 family dipeptidase [Dethiosulfovibrio sp.]